MADSTTTDAPVEDAQATPAEAPKPEAPETDAPVGGEEALGDPGKKALDAMKAQVREAKAEAKKSAEERDRLKAAADGKEAEFEADRKAREQADTRYNERILRAEVKAAAKGALSDPEDAFRFLDMSKFAVDDDGEFDATAVQDAITALIASKPYLAVQDGKRFTGTPDAGARKETGPVQLAQKDLDRMNSGKQYDAIVAAKAAGQFNDLLGIKP